MIHFFSRQGLRHSRWTWNYVTRGNLEFLSLLTVFLVLESTGVNSQSMCRAVITAQASAHARQVFYQLNYIPALLDLFCLKQNGVLKGSGDCLEHKSKDRDALLSLELIFCHLSTMAPCFCMGLLKFTVELFLYKELSISVLQ